MSQMVERVERVIRDNIEAALPLGYAMDYRYAALSAIQAMREPTDEMVLAGQMENNLLPEDRDPPNDFEYLSGEEMIFAWQAMIDAALKP